MSSHQASVELFASCVIDQLKGLSWLQMTLMGPFIVVLATFLYRSFTPGLRKLPGPFWAKYSWFWRMHSVSDGQHPFKLLELHNKHGPLVRIGPKHVSIGDAKQIPLIYGYNTKYSKGPFYDTLTGLHEGTRLDNIFSCRDADEHKRLKAQMMNRYTPASIKALEPMMDDCTDDFIAIMTRYAGEKIDFGKWLHWYAADVIGELTFQTRFGFMKEQKDIHGMIYSMELGANKYGALIGHVPFLHKFLVGSDWTMRFVSWLFPSAPQVFVEMFKIADREMELNFKRQVPKPNPDFLQWLTENMNSGKSDMTQRELLSHIAANLLGGSDTTSSSLRSIFYHLIKTPMAYKKVVAEILGADAKGEISERITYAEALKLPYLQAVIKEAMRLTPAIAHAFDRVVPEGGDVICDTHLPGGTIVGISAVVVHQDKEIYGQDAHIYRPERWLEASEEQLKLMEKVFFTFGYGSRVCIGKNIGLTEVSKFVPRILRRFDIEWASDKPEWDMQMLWFTAQTGVVVRLTPRSIAEVKE